MIWSALLLPMFGNGQKVKSYERAGEKVIVSLDIGEIHLTPLRDDAIRVQYGLDFSTQLPDLIFIEEVTTPDFSVRASQGAIEVATSGMTAIVDKQSGALSYKGKNGKTFLREKPGSRIFKESAVQGASCYLIAQRFDSPSDEYLFGTGQFPGR